MTDPTAEPPPAPAPFERAQHDAQVRQRRLHNQVDAHGRSSMLSDLILGGQDGLVNVLGLVLGVAAATSSTRIVLVAGLAAAFSESVSMAAVAYTSTRAQIARYESEEARERRHVRLYPDLERHEIREIFEKKGLSGETLDRVVDVITSQESTWVSVMMAEEHGLARVEKSQALRSAAVVGLAAIVGSLVPLAPFLVLPVRSGMWAAGAVSAATLFVGGVYKARVTTGVPLKSGAEMTLIGLASALVGYLVGVLLEVGPV